MRRFIFAIAAAAFACLPLAAQERVGLRECIQTGIENNYGLRIARNEQKIAENDATRGNAGQLPTLDLGASFYGSYYDNDDRYEDRTDSYGSRSNYLDIGPTLGWTLFEGFSAKAEYGRLKELAAIGELNTRIALEDLVGSIASEYYTLIRQRIRLDNLEALVRLSRERLRIVEESFNIGASSGMEFQQAQVDYNADNSSLISQMEAVLAIQINLNKLMGLQDVVRPVILADSTIRPDLGLDREELWESMFSGNASLLAAERNRTVSEFDLKRARSRNYPYLNLSAGYGYRRTWDNAYTYDRSDRLGFSYTVSAGITLFDGMNRRREQRNARLGVENSRLTLEQLQLDLKSEMASLWISYTNNITLLGMERENLVTARNNFEIAMERYRLRELAGIELREAQLSLLESEERLSIAEYNIKLCEISLYMLSGMIIDRAAD